MFKTYQKKPVKVEVLKYTNTQEVNDFIISASKNSITPATLVVEVRNCSTTHPEGFDYPVLKFKTLEGDMTVSEGDYVICGTNGEFYPIKPEIFEQCYESNSLSDKVNITKKQLKDVGLALTEAGKKHLDSVLYLLDGALHDHSNRNFGDRDAWFDKIHYEWEGFINEHEESLNPLEYIQQGIKGIT